MNFDIKRQPQPLVERTFWPSTAAGYCLSPTYSNSKRLALDDIIHTELVPAFQLLTRQPIQFRHDGSSAAHDSGSSRRVLLLRTNNSFTSDGQKTRNGISVNPN